MLMNGLNLQKSKYIMKSLQKRSRKVNPRSSCFLLRFLSLSSKKFPAASLCKMCFFLYLGFPSHHPAFPALRRGGQERLRRGAFRAHDFFFFCCDWRCGAARRSAAALIEKTGLLWPFDADSSPFGPCFCNLHRIVNIDENKLQFTPINEQMTT